MNERQPGRKETEVEAYVDGGGDRDGDGKCSKAGGGNGDDDGNGNGGKDGESEGDRDSRGRGINDVNVLYGSVTARRKSVRRLDSRRRQRQ